MQTPENPPAPSAPRPRCISEQQARALAFYISTAVRPDWQVPGILSALAEASQLTRDAGALAAAAVNAARQEKNRTPAVIALPGSHWPPEAAASVSGVRVPPCEDHPEEAAHACRACWADVKAGQRPADMIGRALQPRASVEAVEHVPWRERAAALGFSLD